MAIYDWFIRFCKTKPTRQLLLLAKHHFLPLKTKSYSSIYETWLYRKLLMLYEWSEKQYINEHAMTTEMGPNSLNELPKLIKDSVKSPKCLIVTDKFLASSPIGAKLIKMLEDKHIQTVIYDEITPNPLYESVSEIVCKYRDAKANVLISFGGGSSHDATKSAAMMLSNCEPFTQYQGLNVSTNVAVPFICVNTTAGTGAEVSTTAVITYHKDHKKMLVVDKYMMPYLVINDPNLTLDLPQNATAWTGVDVLVHGIEAYLSNIGSIQSSTYALMAIKLVFQYLSTAYHEPHNLNARDQLINAEYLAGMSFNIASLGYIHSLSHALSGMFNTPHGLANAMLLPHVLTYELRYKKVVKKLAEIARSVGVKDEIDDYNYALALIRKIQDLLNELKIPHKLTVKDHELNKNDINQLAKRAMVDFCGVSNPIQLSQRRLKAIYRQAIYEK